ncbi:MAG TPA: UPF0182 family protein, partial [Geobacteraceae bacterium]|nr:UPF0182 family protein [Geobacteraceae bacterium]
MFKKNRLVIILVAAALIIPFLSSLLDFYADWLFFVETGFTSVFATNLTAKIAAGLGFGVLSLLFALVNLHFANHALFSPMV